MPSGFECTAGLPISLSQCIALCHRPTAKQYCSVHRPWRASPEYAIVAKTRRSRVSSRHAEIKK